MCSQVPHLVLPVCNCTQTPHCAFIHSAMTKEGGLGHKELHRELHRELSPRVKMDITVRMQFIQFLLENSSFIHSLQFFFFTLLENSLYQSPSQIQTERAVQRSAVMNHGTSSHSSPWRVILDNSEHPRPVKFPEGKDIQVVL